MGQIYSLPRAPSILLVEDEALVSMMIEDAMVERGFTVHAAADAAGALRFLAGGAPVDILFTDINLSGEMNGAALARLARELRPQLAVVYASGTLRAVADAVPGSIFVAKPYLPAQVCAMLEEMAAAVA